MKITLQIQILPDTHQTAKLKAIMERFNEAANWVVGELFAGKVTNKIEAQHLCYREVRERFGFGISDGDPLHPPGRRGVQAGHLDPARLSACTRPSRMTSARSA